MRSRPDDAPPASPRRRPRAPWRSATAPSPARRLAPVAPAPAAAARDGRDAVAERLVEIVRDRTGYPAEMLGLDLDLEADLGIDSIKRVEILGSLRDSVAALAASTDSSAMDSLSRARTLGAIVDRVDEIARRQRPRRRPSSSNGAARAGRPAHRHAMADADADPEPARRPSSGPPPGDRAGRAPLASFRAAGGSSAGGVVVVTDDGRGVGRALATPVRGEGHPVVLAGPGKFDLGSPASVDLLLAKARAAGPLAAIVHAAPLRAG